MEKTLKVAIMPGKVEEVAYEGCKTVIELFEMVGMNVDGNYEFKLDGVVVGLSEEVGEGTLLLASKKIKGNGFVKVAVMPGKIVEIAYEGSVTAEELFKMAGFTLDSNYEVKLDGVVVGLNEEVGEGTLLLASKKIKGNK